MNELPIFRYPVYFALLLLAVAALYGGFLQNPPVFDDFNFFAVKGVLEHYLGFHPAEVRWLPYATIAWTAHGIGLEFVWFRLEGLLLHAAVAMSMFLFLHRLFDLALKDAPPPGAGMPNIWMAFFGALLFAVHPVAVYGAAYLLERTIVMATLFSILALYAYLRGLTEGRALWLWGAVFLYAAAVLSKEHAVMLPWVMLALTLLLARPSWALWRRLWSMYVGCALIALYVLLQKLGVLGVAYEVDAAGMLGELKVENAYPLSVLTQCTLFFKYLLLWFIPNPQWMSIDMREPFAAAIWSARLLALAGFVAYGVVACKLLLARGRTGLLGFALLFPWLLFFTEFATVRVQESFVLYRSYLWMAGVFAALPFLLGKLTGRWVFAGISVTAMVFAVLAVNRLTVFEHPLLLWADAEVLVRDKPQLPGVARIYYNLGTSLTSLHRYEEALKAFLKAQEMDPKDVNNTYAIGVGYMNVARYADALAAFERTLELNPKHVQAQLGRGLCHLELGNKALALQELRQSCDQGFKSACAKVQEVESGRSK